MNLRERLEAVLTGKPADAIPWYTDLTYWHHGQMKMGKLESRYNGAEGLLRLHRDLGVGVYLFTPPLVKACRDSELFTHTHTKIDEKRTRVTTKSPAGDLTSVIKDAPESYSTAILEYPVKTADDLRVVREWYEATTYEANYGDVLACDAEWGDCGFAVPLIPRTPLAALAAEWTGVMNLSYIAADAPDELETTLETMRRCEDEMYRLYAQSPLPVLEIGENLSSEAMGGLWRRYSREYYRERTAQLHDAGKLVGCHIDGTLGTLLGDIVQAGIDIPESVVPAPVGDLSLEEIRDVVGEDTIIWGCIPSAMFSPPFDRETVLDFVRKTIDVLGKDRRLVLAGADQVPPGGDIELVRIIGELIEEIGWPT